MKTSILLLGLLTIIQLFSCGNTPNKHEKLFLNTAADLNSYRHVSTIQKQLSNPLVRDYMVLTFSDFKESYTMSDAEMDVLAKGFRTTVAIAKAYQAIEDNIERTEKLE